jgi:hypothetical protein
MRRPNAVISLSRADRNTAKGGARAVSEYQYGKPVLDSHECSAFFDEEETDLLAMTTFFSSEAIPSEITEDKSLFREASLLYRPYRLLSTWGRIQRQEEVDYAKFLQFTDLPPAATAFGEGGYEFSGDILEAFDGFVDKIDGEIAYVTLKTGSGELLWIECPVTQLQNAGIRERRRFKCWTVTDGSEVRLEMCRIPDALFTADDERRLEQRLRRQLGDDDAPQNDE